MMFEELSEAHQLPSDLADYMADPLASLKKVSEQMGRTPVGLLCPAVPAEIPWALGGLPFLIPAVSVPGGLADAALQSFCCIRVRSVAELILDGRMGDSAVIASVAGSCDSLQNMASVIRTLRPEARVSMFSLPIARRGESASDFTGSQIMRWADEMADLMGKPALTEDQFADSLEIWENLRAALMELEGLSAAGWLRRSSFLAVARAALMAPPDRSLKWIEEMRRTAEAADPEPPDDEQVRLGLVAGPLDHLGILSDMEDLGAHFVWDDSCTGTTLAAARALGTGSALERLARRLTTEFICPVVFGSGSVRHRRFVDRMAERSARAALLLIWKFCDPHAFDNALFKRRFKEQNIPFLELELDPVMSSRGQMQTRCQAFLESLSDFEA